VRAHVIADESRECEGPTKSERTRWTPEHHIYAIIYTSDNIRNKTKKELNSKVYSPPCAAITSCSTRGACSPVGCSRKLEYASWGQATICQIRPIAHVRCAVYSVLFSRVCVANVSCMQHGPPPPLSRCVVTLRKFS